MKAAITATFLMATLSMLLPSTGVLAQQQPPATELPKAASPAEPPEGQPPGADLFVSQLASTNLFGIELAGLAQKRSNTTRIRALAEKIVGTDQKSQDELQAAANERGIRFQANLSAEQAGKLNALKDAPEDQVDQVFLSARMTAAKTQMSLISLYGSKGQAGALKRYALSEFQQVRAGFLEAHEMSGK